MGEEGEGGILLVQVVILPAFAPLRAGVGGCRAPCEVVIIEHIPPTARKVWFSLLHLVPFFLCLSSWLVQEYIF
jgi:hypothetical protein